MSSIRNTKRAIAYLTGEVISNCSMALYFQGEASHEPLMAVIEEAADLHNTLIDKANHPAEKHNPKLVKKHYRALEKEMYAGVDAMFEKISTICQKKK